MRIKTTVAALLLVAVLAYATTLNLTVNASSDDAAENSALVVLLSGASFINAYSGGARWAGVRFENVTIPKNSTINSATASLYITTAGVFDLTVFANDVDDAATYSTGEADISLRAQTTASAEWDDASTTLDTYETSPDLTAIVQEIIDRSGWASGNHLALLYRINSNNTSRAAAFDHASSGNEPKLDIDYTVNGRRVRKTFYFN